MKFVSLFAGVGGFDLGLERAGHECIGQVEIDKHSNKVLDRHWPNVPRWDDVQTAKGWADEIGLVGATDLVCGGFPCQDVSVAGKRAGIAGARSGLFFDALGFAVYVKAETIILENVPGLLSSNGGRDFGTVLTEMASAGYRHIEWRLLDSQFFGVPQRRRRIFIVGSVRDRSGSPVFIERKSLSGDLKKIKTEKQDSSSIVARSIREAKSERVIFHAHRSDGARIQDKTINTLTSYMGTGGLNTPMIAYPMHGGIIGRKDENGPSGSGFAGENDPSYTLTASGQSRHGVATFGESSFGQFAEGKVSTLKASGGGMGGGSETLVFTQNQREEVRDLKDVAGALIADSNSHQTNYLADASTVRRLTPVECERLQGFPDNWTDVVADTHRYKQMGNAVTVNVIEWIGQRLRDE